METYSKNIFRLLDNHLWRRLWKSSKKFIQRYMNLKWDPRIGLLLMEKGKAFFSLFFFFASKFQWIFRSKSIVVNGTATNYAYVSGHGLDQIRIAAPLFLHPIFKNPASSLFLAYLPLPLCRSAFVSAICEFRMVIPSNANRPQNRSAMVELKYRRVVELNQKLREDFDRPRCKTSEACNKYPLLAIFCFYFCIHF